MTTCVTGTVSGVMPETGTRIRDLILRLLCGLIMYMAPAVLYAQNDTSASGYEGPAADFSISESGGMTAFQPLLRPLRQIAGAPPAYYSCYWEFGDGTFSFREEPEHYYERGGAHEVMFYATNNYDDGKAPPRRSKKYEVPGEHRQRPADLQRLAFFEEEKQLQMKTNRMPRPDEEMVCIAGYRNPLPASVSGTLVFFFNEKEFSNRNFDFREARLHHGEVPADLQELSGRPELISFRYEAPRVYYASASDVEHPQQVSYSPPGTWQLLQERQHIYTDHRAWHIDNLGPGEERYLFMTLQTTPEMIRDTNAVVVLNMMFIPDDPKQQVVSEELELQIVASHDPNKIGVSNRIMNYRFLGGQKELKYKVRFQNTGKGPASTIDVGVTISGNLNPATLRIKGQYPECIPCAEAVPGQSCLDTVVHADSNRVHFIFRNVYLPGTAQEGVSDRDSTKGFVEFYMKMKQKPPKRSFYSQAAIVFDKNEPVYTNRARNHFRPGLSPALMLGYNFEGKATGLPAAGSYLLGAALAPYAPWRFYLQAEGYVRVMPVTAHSYQLPVADGELLRLQDTLFELGSRDVREERKAVSIELVPIQLRKNFTRWLGAGAGVWVSGSINRETVYRETLTLYSCGCDEEIPRRYTRTVESREGAFSEMRFAGFLDVSLGLVRTGPSLGARWMRFPGSAQDRFMVYAAWRF